jgi:outer membrane immunogenic protein
MKKLALTAISLLIAGSASAADLRRPVPVKAAPAPIAVGYNWTGCYVGAGGGYGMFDQETSYLSPAPTGGSWDTGGRGWFGTVQVGCDYQVGSNIVIGAFGDYDFSGIKGDVTFPFQGPVVAEEKLKNSWAAGGRIGYLPFQQQQLLVYVSGGYTQARFDQADFRFLAGGAPAGVSLAKHTYSGWFLGSGYEYQLGWFPGLTWKTEYRFADYSADTVPLLVTPTGAPRGDAFDSRKFVQTIRSELVWRFNFGGPVVARY